MADLMSREPIVVRDSDSIAFAETVLRDFRITGVPVVNREGVLVGVFSQTDALFLKRPSVAGLIGHGATAQVGDVMSTPAITVSALASLTEAATIMLDNEVHRIVAVDERGHPIGVLSAMDYVRRASEGQDDRHSRDEEPG